MRAMVREPPALEDPASDGLVFRRGKLRKREDDEVRMMRDVLAHLGDTARVTRTLLELGRFYNPVTHGPVVDPETRHAVIASLDAGDVLRARALLEAHLRDYLKMDERPPAPVSRARGGTT